MRSVRRRLWEPGSTEHDSAGPAPESLSRGARRAGAAKEVDANQVRGSQHAADSGGPVRHFPGAGDFAIGLLARRLRLTCRFGDFLSLQFSVLQPSCGNLRGTPLLPGKASGKYEMATLELREGMSVSSSVVRRLTKEALRLNQSLGDPREAATPKRKSKRPRTKRARSRS